MEEILERESTPKERSKLSVIHGRENGGWLSEGAQSCVSCYRIKGRLFGHSVQEEKAASSSSLATLVASELAENKTGLPKSGSSQRAAG